MQLVPKMNSSVRTHSIDYINDVNDKCGSNWFVRRKYATIEKINTSSQSDENLAKFKQIFFLNNHDWFQNITSNHIKRDQVSVNRKGDAAKYRTMQYTNKSVNRNGTIARNHFRGVPADYLHKQTKHFLLSMTVSIR